MQDDVYDGHFLPAGSICIANIWYTPQNRALHFTQLLSLRGMLHDHATYLNPKEFVPERFLSDHGKPAEIDSRETVFGFGRR